MKSGKILEGGKEKKKKNINLNEWDRDHIRTLSLWCASLLILCLFDFLFGRDSNCLSMYVLVCRTEVER
jgi:hypothetical protein